MKRSVAILGALLFFAPLLFAFDMPQMPLPEMIPLSDFGAAPESAPAAIPGMPPAMTPASAVLPAPVAIPVPVPEAVPVPIPVPAPYPPPALPALPANPQTPPPAPESAPQATQEKKPMEMPEFAGIAGWLNSDPLTKASLKGKVVLVDFWTYSCVNCVRTLPVLKEWYKKYKDRGLVIIGVHSPEFEFEKDPVNVKLAVQKFGILYPVALDNQMATWAAYQNNVWPAHYFIDATGKVRHIHLGEGDYDESEQMIQKLLMEKDAPKPETQPAESQPATQPAESQPESQPATETKPAPARRGRKGRKGAAAVSAPTTATTAPAAPAKPNPAPEIKPASMPALSKIPPNVDFSQIKSPETYLGLLRRERLVTSGRPIEINEWMYDGKWRTEGDRIVLAEGTGKLYFRFNATKVNLVMSPTAGGVQAVVKIDGQPVSATQAGSDVKNGTVMITEPRMYELINLGTQGSEHVIEIEFLNPGAAAYAFTFG